MARRRPRTDEPIDQPPKSPCPDCGKAQWLRIVYGLPGPELWERAERGDVALGGCIVWPDMPRWSCGGCGRPSGGTPMDA